MLFCNIEAYKSILADTKNKWWTVEMAISSLKAPNIDKWNIQPFAVETVLWITDVRIQEVRHHLLQLVNSWNSRLLLLLQNSHSFSWLVIVYIQMKNVVSHSNKQLCHLVCFQYAKAKQEDHGPKQRKFCDVTFQGSQCKSTSGCNWVHVFFLICSMLHIVPLKWNKLKLKSLNCDS